MPKALVVLADGFEEIEAFTSIDVLRRAGVDVVTAGLVSTMVTGMHGTKAVADKRLDEVDAAGFNALILPGGRGYINLMNSARVLGIVKDFETGKKIIAAICMAPAVLAKAGILEKHAATIYPGSERLLPKPRSLKVCVDGNVITSQSPGTAIAFALKIVEALCGVRTAKQVESGLVI